MDSIIGGSTAVEDKKVMSMQWHAIYGNTVVHVPRKLLTTGWHIMVRKL